MRESLGLNTLIVTTLKEYGTIPVYFLARILGRRTSEIVDYLEGLEQEGAIKREGEHVGLSSKIDRRTLTP